MPITFVKLKLVGRNRYAIFGPEGNQISGVFQGPKEKAKEWARSFCSSWYNWGVDYKEIDDEETGGIPKQDL